MGNFKDFIFGLVGFPVFNFLFFGVPFFFGFHEGIFFNILSWILILANVYFAFYFYHRRRYAFYGGIVGLAFLFIFGIILAILAGSALGEFL